MIISERTTSYDSSFQPEGEDELKKKQLMELAILNGTYRNAGAQNQNVLGQQQLAAAAAAINKGGLLRKPC